MGIPEMIAIAVFLFTYALIIDGRIHRAVAAMMGAAVIVLAGVVPWDKVPQYIDFGTIFLLMGMMIIVNTARHSGLFEYIAIRTAKMAKGDPIKVLVLFAIVTAIVSAFLDNVTTVLLLTPMLIYIARVMDVSIIPYLVGEIFASNIGGAATLIGDPPNIMIGSAAGLTFNDFIINMGPVAVIDLVIIIGLMVILNRKTLHADPEKHEKILSTIMALNEEEAIKDRVLFRKSIITILFVVGMFFIHAQLGLEPAAVALVGASIILFWSRLDPAAIFEKIEWTALFFFGGLFVVVGALVETGLIGQIAMVVVNTVDSPEEAMIVIAWFAAIASAFVDNIPLTATLIPLIQDMGASMDISTLWWGLSLGACLGGNGTAIGASANVVVLGIAERENIHITFMDFLKKGMLVLFITVGVGVAVLWFRFFVL